MHTILTVLSALLVFGILVLVHETGHFVTAKLVGIKIHEFSIGMGPSIKQFIKGDTKYSLRLLPIGGYVQMEGEDEESCDENAFCNKKVWQKILVVVNGAVMNILLGYILIVMVTSWSGMASTTVIAEFQPEATSNQMLCEEDRIVSVNGRKIHLINEVLFEFIRDSDGLIDMEVIREGEKVLLTNIPFKTTTVEGVQMLTLDFLVYGAPRTFLNTMYESFYLTTSVVRQVWVSFIDLVTGRFGFNQLSGPIGVSGAIGDAVDVAIQDVNKSGFSLSSLSSPITMMAYISINLGVFNLLPLPALDGGRLFFLLIEAVIRRPVPAKYEGFIHGAGFLALIALMIAVTFQDILKLFA